MSCAPDAVPMPSLNFYANDIGDFIRAISERGIHPTETEIVARMLQDMATENDTLRDEARAAQTFRDNSDAEELADLQIDLATAQARITDLEIQLHDLKRKKK